jgi:hypothetical protein
MRDFQRLLAAAASLTFACGGQAWSQDADGPADMITNSGASKGKTAVKGWTGEVQAA